MRVTLMFGAMQVAQYQTVQRRLLLKYLELNCEQAFSVEELAECMRADPSFPVVPGISTIYRIMPMLVQDGLVKRFVKSNSRQFLYQMVCGEHCDRHLHLKCSVCGKIFHMEDNESREILKQVLKNQNFSIDERTTVLFGHCQNCM